MNELTANSSRLAGVSKETRHAQKHREALPDQRPPSRAKQNEDSAKTNFDQGDDFIPFPVSNPPSPSQIWHPPQNRYPQPNRLRDRGEPSFPDREWDKGKTSQRDPYVRDSRADRWEGGTDRGKGKARDSSRERNPDRNRGKRKLEVDTNDEYENKRWRVDPSARKAPWVADVNWERCNNVAELMHKEVEAFLKYISPTPAEDEVRGLVVQLITNAVTEAFPDATVHPFGSYETKLYLPLGDIDLVILSDSMAYSKKVTVLRALANALKRAQITPKVSIIATAKVPILKFITTHGRFRVDISINHGNGITAGKIINGFLKDMHGTGQGLALRSLIMITKLFLSQRNMNEVFTGGLGSYSIVCLAISFLQMHPKIRRGEIDPEKNLGALVVEFFELYGCYFNYDEVGISVRKGGKYYSKRRRGWLDDRKSHLLSIEDPADPSNDISRGSYGIAKIRATFAGAHGILTTAAYTCAGTMGSRREGRAHLLRRRFEPEDLSILSRVVGVTQETINHRRLVQEVYEKKTFHSLLNTTLRTNSPDRVDINGYTNGTPEVDSEGERGYYRSTARRRSDYEDQLGRYGIGQGHQNKRRKMGRPSPVYTADEEQVDNTTSEYVDSRSPSEEGFIFEELEPRRPSRQRIRT